ncbi:hypothetical protein GCM10007320_09030 [Pseudorhodoferax aquiterrae]|uniref:Uncharacterized protein n=1 Tax=Pseudorhodoferax aquiterrae TaxID=747304 RepID=A0ABQ3FWH0_9BURK|nr:hypothetical protein [Pseudorhodoferax aquiterrae]GHC72854.1 hypothetical protein GCM10007320_09030 [Pseudorhodoferax aquiterrae]
MSTLPRPLTAPQITFIELQRRNLMEQRAAEFTAEQFASREPIGADPRVLDFMRRRGGSFISRLAEAWLRADPINSAKLSMAFADQYRDYAKQLAAAGAQA